MAAVDVLPPTGVPTAPALRPFSSWKTPSGAKPLISENAATTATAAADSETVTFDAKKHLSYTPPSKVHSMTELGYSEYRGVSPVGVSEPFALFSPEAVQKMRAEVLSPHVWDKYRVTSNLSQCQLRGYAAE